MSFDKHHCPSFSKMPCFQMWRHQYFGRTFEQIATEKKLNKGKCFDPFLIFSLTCRFSLHQPISQNFFALSSSKLECFWPQTLTAKPFSRDDITKGWKGCLSAPALLTNIVYKHNLDQLLTFTSTPTSLLSFKIKCLRFPSILIRPIWFLSPSLLTWYFNYFCKYFLF